MQTGIANLLSVGWLERHGWDVGYKTGSAWKVTSPGGSEITFQRDVGALDGFPFVDLRTPEVQSFFAKVAAERITAHNDHVERAVFAQNLNRTGPAEPSPLQVVGYVDHGSDANDVIAHPHDENVEFAGDADDYSTDYESHVGELAFENNEFALISTVRKNFEGFTKREVKEAKNGAGNPDANGKPN